MTTETTNLESMEVAVPAALVAECRPTSPVQPNVIGEAVGAAIRRIDAFLKSNAIVPSGSARVVYHEWGPLGVKFAAQMPIAAVPHGIVDTADVSIKATTEARALRFTHRGPYVDIRMTYDRIEAWLRERGGIKTAADWARYSPMWEEYLNDPTSTPASELVTRIYLTLR